MTDVLLVIIAMVLIGLLALTAWTTRANRAQLAGIQHTVNSDRDRMLAKIDALLETNESLHEEIRRLVSADAAGHERGIAEQKAAHRSPFRQRPPEPTS